MLGDETPFLTKIGLAFHSCFLGIKFRRFSSFYVGPNGENSMASFLP
jgi:hypothetical protein